VATFSDSVIYEKEIDRVLCKTQVCLYVLVGIVGYKAKKCYKHTLSTALSF
jgi:hypothetical protein